MTENRVWAIRDIFNDGNSTLIKSFFDLDKKAQFWMGISLAGLLGLPSYGLRNDFQNLPYFVLSACSCWICFLLATIFLSKTLKLRKLSTGILTIENCENFQPFDYFLVSDRKWKELERDQAEFAFLSFNKNKTTCSDKAKKLVIAEALLFWGIPICLCLAFTLELFIHYISPDPFGLFSCFGLIPSRIFCGFFVGICVCVFIIIFCHSKFPYLLEFFNSSYKRIASIFKLLKFQKTVTKSTPKE